MNGKIGYRSDIDALRAIAVLPVLAFHMDSEFVPGGYLGVDVFFVISGYLITSLLVAELSSGRLDVAAFWRRRILRIVPALLTMVTITFLVGQVLLFAPERHDLALNSTAAILSVGNISHFVNYGGYWGGDSELSPLLHTWSLGVEEQFYLFYPLLFVMVFRLWKKLPFWLLPSLVFTSLALFIYGADEHPDATFYLIPTRVWELAAGGVAATLFLTPMTKWAARASAWTGLLLIFVAYLCAPQDGIGMWNIVSVLGAALIVATRNPEPFSALKINNRVVTFVGLISYSLYLWHYPVIVFSDALNVRFSVALGVLEILGLVFFLAWLSWRFVETPTRKLTRHALVVVSVSFMVAIAAYSMRAWNNQEDLSGYRPTQWAGSLFDVSPGVLWPEKPNRKLDGVSPSVFTGGTNIRVVGDPAYLEGITHYYGGNSIDVMVLGDSHAQMWAPVIDSIMKEKLLSVNYMVANGTEVFFEVPLKSAVKGNAAFTAHQLTEYRKSRLDQIKRLRPEVVIIASRWRESQRQKSHSLMEELNSIGAKVLLIESPPELSIGDRSAPQFFSFIGIRPDKKGNAETDLINWERNSEAESVLGSLLKLCADYCQKIETKDLFLSGGGNAVKVISGNQILYIDDDHLSVAGAEMASNRIKSEIESKLKSLSNGENVTLRVSNDPFFRSEGN